MTSFLLKIIGIITMLCDHVGDSIIGAFSNWNLIGRIAFPIFAFQISQGYIHTRDLKKYLLRLTIFACISQIPFCLFLSTFNDSFTLNIFFTFVLAIIGLYLFDKIKSKFIGLLFVLLICHVGQLIHVDYGAFGIGSVFIFYLFSKLYNNENISAKRKWFYKVLMCITYFIMCMLKYLYYFIYVPVLNQVYIKMTLFTFLPILLIIFYNGRQGPKLKYLFYVFYPLHLIILWAMHTFI